LNFFSVGNSFRLVDLPGYGYAHIRFSGQRALATSFVHAEILDSLGEPNNACRQVRTGTESEALQMECYH